MPIHKTSIDYIDEINEALQKRYSLTLPKRVIKKILDQSQQSIIHHLKQRDHITITNHLSLHQTVPRVRQ